MLTDEESHHLNCKEETITDVTEVGISRWGLPEGRLELRVGKGSMLYLNDRIRVAIRIDKGEVVRGEWEWFGDNMVAILRNRDLIMSLMEELARGKRVVIQVGEERGNVILRGSAAAIKDFRTRIRQPEAANSSPVLPLNAAPSSEPAGRNSPEDAARAREATEDLRALPGTEGVGADQPPGGVQPGLQEIRMRTYKQRVRALIMRALHLPMMQRTAQALEAIALLTIDREGQVIRYELTRSSGNMSFDASVHRAVQASSPLPPLPETYSGEILEAEIFFTPPESS